MGYLYLTERFERMAELLGSGLQKLGEIPNAEAAALKPQEELSETETEALGNKGEDE